MSLIASTSPCPSAFLTVSFDCFFPPPPLGSLPAPPSPQVAIAMRVNEFPDRHLQHLPQPRGRRRGGVGRRSLCQIWVAHWVVDRKFDHHLRRRQLSMFSILIMRSFCFLSSFVLLFSPEAPSLCTSCAPDCTFFPLEGGASSLLTWKLCHATRIKISSRSSKRGLNIGRARRGGMGKGRRGKEYRHCEWEWEWENRKLNQCGSRAKWKSWSGSRNWIRFRIRIRVFNMRTLCQLLCES